MVVSKREMVLVKLPSKMAEALDRQVQAGCFTTRADFLRHACREELYRQHSKQVGGGEDE